MVKQALSTIILIIALVKMINKGYSQCPTSDFDVNSSACLNENIIVSNTSLNYSSYEWSFCDSDYLTALDGTELFTLTNISAPRDIVSVPVNNGIYSFIIGENNRLIRLFFANGITNSPDITNLQNLGGAISIPKGIEYFNENGNHYLLIAQQGGTLLLLSFGADLNSIPTSNLVVGITSLNSIRGLKILEANSGTIILYAIGVGAGSRQVGVINFGNSIENIPSYSEFSLPTASGLTSFSIIKECDNWYGFVSSTNNNKLFKLFFGVDPTTLDSSQELLGITTPYAVDLKSINNRYYATVSSEAGNLFRIDFGEDFTIMGSESFNDLGNLGILTSPVGLDIFSWDNGFEGLTVGYTDKKLRHLIFTGTCPITTSSEQINLNISFSIAGTYDISLITVDDDGSVDRLSKSITVSSDIAPSISFTSQNICQSSPIQFTSESSSGGLTYTWDFGDGSPTSGDASPTHTYSTAGDYEVTLSVDDGTCGNFTKQTITIYDEPAPDFSVPGGNICTNQPYLFENTTPGDFGGFITYSWVLDGVPISTDQDLDITFSSGGTKELKLIASIPGCDIEIAKNLTNVREGTLPIFSFDDSCVGEEVLFTNSTLGDITDVNWEFSNGFTSSLNSPLMVFDEEGTYDVTLNIINADGCETFDTQTITIHALPIIDFSNELACEELTTQFEDLSTVNIDNLSSWRWDFGDGSDVSNDQNASHIFDANGDYEVELTAISSFGCIDSLTKTVTVLKAPEASFDFDKICLDVPIQFTDASTAVEGEEITDWSWNLGGTFSAQQNPQVTFENSLDYTVSLTVTSSNLCTATQTQLISIPETPTLDFSLVDDCENETGQISDVTEIFGDNISNRSWLINGNQVSSESTFEYDFVQAGSYDVTLMLNTENGCEYETIRPVTIHPAPTSNFVTSFDFGAPPFVVDFTNQSSGAQTYSWKFEDGAVSDDLNPSYTFNNLGDFDVSLVAISDQNCTDTTSRRIQVLEPLLDAEVLNFNILPTATGDKLSFAIRNNGTIRLDSLNVTVNLGGELEIYETINRAMNPNEVISAQLALTLDNKRLDYICIDVKPFISNYQDVDEDNNRSCITFGQETFIVSNPYPNPSTSLVAFDVIATKDAVANIELLSSEGHLLNTFNIEVFQGNNKLDFDLSQLKSGLYFLKVKLDGLNKVRRIVINN